MIEAIDIKRELARSLLCAAVALGCVMFYAPLSRALAPGDGGNDIDINQLGDSNSITIDQIGEANSLQISQLDGSLRALQVVLQNGIGNHAALSASGAENDFTLTQRSSLDPLFRSFVVNRAQINQLGLGNRGRADQFEGDSISNSLTLSQSGRVNNLSVLQRGVSYFGNEPNSLFLSQEGERNAANLSQIGEGLSLTARQIGNENSLRIAQSGFGQTFDITQTGNGLTLNIDSFSIVPIEITISQTTLGGF